MIELGERLTSASSHHHPLPSGPALMAEKKSKTKSERKHKVMKKIFIPISTSIAFYDFFLSAPPRTRMEDGRRAAKVA